MDQFTTTAGVVPAAVASPAYGKVTPVVPVAVQSQLVVVYATPDAGVA